ncbi:LLM class flavin-dependent oxidoreductase [Kitasatospora sp. NPDC048540]|uniref:LLM class flavin-dependent oxidoreductase n=1 Tax=Kitasatospora sp. NPDC048540 TaxID=3155634 RepID=UPI0033C8BA2B
MTAGRPTATTPLLLAAIGPNPTGPGTAAPGLRELKALARAAEQAGLDALLLGDGTPAAPGRFEATTAAAALCAVTEHIGLLVRTPPGDLAPYHLARITASLDHLGRGRAGWCADGTGPGTAAAAEYLEVVKGLWESFDADAFVHDRESGQYWHLDRIHRLDHDGPHYSVAGPLNVARPPQGHPVVAVTDPALAGGADLVLLDTTDPAEARRLRTRIRQDAADRGGDADHVKVIATLRTGSGTDPADLIARWTEQQAADGFVATITAPDDPFLTTAVPELRRRGLLGAGPLGAAARTTLRERLGLPRPDRRPATV